MPGGRHHYVARNGRERLKGAAVSASKISLDHDAVHTCSVSRTVSIGHVTGAELTPAQTIGPYPRSTVYKGYESRHRYALVFVTSPC